MGELIDKKIGNEVDGAIISDVFEGYTFKITGRYDKDGFAMKNGILTRQRRDFFFRKAHPCSDLKRVITEEESEPESKSEGALFPLISKSSTLNSSKEG